MPLAHLLSESRVLPDLAAPDKGAVIHRLAALLAEDLHGVTAAAVGEALMERERLSTTGIGHGIAVPHGRLAGLDAPMAALARLPAGVAFEAMDGEPVHLVVALISPAASATSHLQALALISQTLLRATSRERLLAARDRRELYLAVLAESENL